MAADYTFGPVMVLAKGAKVPAAGATGTFMDLDGNPAQTYSMYGTPAPITADAFGQVVTGDGTGFKADIPQGLLRFGTMPPIAVRALEAPITPEEAKRVADQAVASATSTIAAEVQKQYDGPAAEQAVQDAAAGLGIITSPMVGRIVAVPDGDPLPVLADGDLVIRYAPPVVPGATYFTDFTEYATGAVPGDFTQRWTLRDWTVADESGNKVLTTVGGSGRSGLEWTDVTPDPDRADVEVLMRWKAATAGNGPTIILRASGALGAETGYRLGVFSPTHVTIGRYNAGTFTELASKAMATAADTYYLTRARANGSTLQIKTWLASDPEPTGWDNTVTDAAPITAAGWVGIAGTNAGAKTVDYLAVATAGRTAVKP